MLAASCDTIDTGGPSEYLNATKPAPALAGGRGVVLTSCLCSTKTRTGYDPDNLTLFNANPNGVTGVYVSPIYAVPDNATWDLNPQAKFSANGIGEFAPTDFYVWVKSYDNITYYWGSVNLTLDQSAPALSSVSIKTNNSFKPGPSSPPAYARAGDTITVSFTAGEELSPPTVLIHGRSATVTQIGSGGTNWEASLVMASSDNDTTSVPFTINYADTAGNVGPTTTATTDSSSVTFDKTPPASLSASITTTDPSSTLPISVAISASDNGTKVSAYNIANNFSASAAPAAPSPTATGWNTISSPLTSYSATVAHNLDNIGDGNRKVYVWFRDGAGNVSSEATDNITIDTQPPILTEDTPVGDSVSNSLHSSTFRLTDNATPLVTLRSSENGTLTYPSSTCKSASTSITVSGNFSITLDSNASGGALADGNYASCQVTMTDDAGNASAPLTLTNFTVDATDPGGTVSKVSSTWDFSVSRTKLTLGLNATDNLSGVVGWLAKDNDSTTPVLSDNWTSITAVNPFSDNTSTFHLNATAGVRTFYTWYRDAAGNISPPATTIITTPSAFKMSSDNASPGYYNAGKLIDLWVEFDDLVTVDTSGGTPFITIYTAGDNSSPTSRTVNYTSGSGTTKLRFLYTVQAGDNTSAFPDLRYSGANTLNKNGAMLHKMGIQAITDLPTPGATNSLSANTDLFLDTFAPSTTSVKIHGNPTSAAEQTNTRSVILELGARDEYGVTAYFDNSTDNTTTPSSPGLSSSGWNSVTQNTAYSDNLSYTLDNSSGDGIKKVSVWYRDAAGNISSPSSTDTIELDTIRPTLAISGLSTKTGYPGTGPGPYKSGDNLSMTLTFSELVQNNGTPHLLFSGTFSGNSTFSLPTTLSLNAYDNQTVGGGSGNESISVFNLMDEAHNLIIPTPTTLDNGTTSGDWFLVDNQVPDNISVQFIDSSSSVMGCSRELGVTLKIKGDDNDYIKSLYIDNSNTQPSSPTITSIDNKSYDNSTVSHSLDNCSGSGQPHTDTLSGTSWPKRYYGCPRDVSIWFEDYAGNINSENATINYDPIRARVLDVDAEREKYKAPRFPHWPIYNAATNSQINIYVTLSENVTVSSTGTPNIYLNPGPVNSPASSSYSSGTGTDNHTYFYRVQAGDNTSSSAPLKLDNSTVAFNGAVLSEDSLCFLDNLSLATPLDNNSIRSTKSIVLDTTPPVANSFDIYDHDNTTFNQQKYSDNVTLGFNLSAKDEHAISEYIVLDNTCAGSGFASSAINDNHSFVGSPLGGGTNTHGTGWVSADNSTLFTLSDNGTALDCTVTSAQNGENRNVYFYVVDLAGNISLVSSNSKDNISFDNQLPKPDYIHLLYCGGQTGGTSPNTCGDNGGDYPGLGGGTGVNDTYLGHDEPTKGTAGFIDNGSGNTLTNLADNASFDATYRQPLSVEQIQIVYNEPTNTRITVNGGTNACTGILQVSSDNFSTNSCLPLQADNSVNLFGTPDNRTWTFNLLSLPDNESCPIAPKGNACRARFEDNTTYTVKLSSIRDSSFNASDNLTTNFSTTPRPTITSSSPDNDSSNRSVYTLPKFVFDSYMDPKSFIAGTSVLISPDNISFIPRYDHYQKTLGIHPMGPLPENTEITITVKGGFDNDTSTGPQADNGTYTYLQGNCKTQGPGMRDENLLTEGGTYGGGLQYCGDHADDRVFMKSDYQLTFKTRQSLNNGLVTHYTLDSNTLDHANLWGNNALTAISTPTTTFGRDNDSGRAYLFDGSNYLDSGGGIGGTLTASNLTLCAWAYPTSFSARNTVLSYGAGANRISIGFVTTNGHLRISGASVVTASRGTHFGAHEYGLNRWTHLCAVDNATGLYLYADAELINSSTGSSTLGGSSLSIGRSVNTGERFVGRIDDVKVYNRSLSQGEVFDIYFEESRGLEGYYPLAGNGNDYSGNNRNGTIASMGSRKEGWNGKADDALEFSGSDNDNVNVNFGSSLHTPNFTYIAWGFPETYNNKWYNYKTLVSSTQLRQPSNADWQSLLTGDGLIDSTTYNSCSWRTSVQDNVTMHSNDYLERTTSATPATNLYTDMSLQTGRVIQIDSIRTHKAPTGAFSDYTTYTGATFNGITLSGSGAAGRYYFTKKDSNSRFKLLKRDASGKENIATSFIYSDNESLNKAVDITFRICDARTFLNPRSGIYTQSNTYLTNGENFFHGDNRPTFLRGWLLDHHRRDTTDGWHWQSFLEFYTDDATDRNGDGTVDKFDCYDSFLLDPTQSFCPQRHRYYSTSPSWATVKDVVDYKGWQMLSARGYGSKVEFLRNGVSQFRDQGDGNNSQRENNLRYADTITIGGIRDVGYEYVGRIDDVRLYSRPLTNDEITTLYTVVDPHAPVPGGTPTLSGGSLTWARATDDHTAQTALQYKVFRYVGNAASNLIGTAETALRNGTQICNWTADLTSCSATGTNRHFTVLVRDNAGNISAYQTIHNP